MPFSLSVRTTLGEGSNFSHMCSHPMSESFFIYFILHLQHLIAMPVACSICNTFPKKSPHSVNEDECMQWIGGGQTRGRVEKRLLCSCFLDIIRERHAT